MWSRARLSAVALPATSGQGTLLSPLQPWPVCGTGLWERKVSSVLGGFQEAIMDTLASIKYIFLFLVLVMEPRALPMRGNPLHPHLEVLAWLYTGVDHQCGCP